MKEGKKRTHEWAIDMLKVVAISFSLSPEFSAQNIVCSKKKKKKNPGWMTSAYENKPEAISYDLVERFVMR